MKSRFAILLAASFCGVSSLSAQSSVSFAPAGDESANFRSAVLLTGLDNPTGLAIRQSDEKTGPAELLFAESGAARVLRVSTDALDQVDEVIVDFPLSTFGRQPKYRVGPLGLAFLTHAKLTVSAKGERPGADIVAAYVLPTDGSILSAAEQDHSVGPLDGNIASQVGDLQLSGLAMTERVCFITASGKDSHGWILKAGLKANRLAYLQPFVDVQKIVGFGAPAGVAVIPEPRPPFLVVGLIGSREMPQDSRLAYFEPASGELALNLPTGLHDIISLAYSPTGHLYAADFSWQDEQAGGVYRIDDARIEGQQTSRAVKIASVVRPFGLAFSPDGSLFVTSFGAGENTKQGELIKITGEL